MHKLTWHDIGGLLQVLQGLAPVVSLLALLITLAFNPAFISCACVSSLSHPLILTAPRWQPFPHNERQAAGLLAVLARQNRRRRKPWRPLGGAAGAVLRTG
jgi:hypothetical protein